MRETDFWMVVVEHFNHAMFGPALPEDGYPAHWVYRRGDEIVVDVGLFGDHQALPRRRARRRDTGGGRRLHAAGLPYLVPVLSQHHGGDLALTRDLTVEVSYDEGATSVSLRASATDREGNTARQTVIKAYKLRK